MQNFQKKFSLSGTSDGHDQRCRAFISGKSPDDVPTASRRRKETATAKEARHEDNELRARGGVLGSRVRRTRCSPSPQPSQLLLGFCQFFRRWQAREGYI